MNRRNAQKTQDVHNLFSSWLKLVSTPLPPPIEIRLSKIPDQNTFQLSVDT